MGETHENPEKEAYDQKSGIGKAQTDDEGLKRLELVKAWVNTQFQPLVFSVESNPALSAMIATQAG